MLRQSATIIRVKNRLNAATVTDPAVFVVSATTVLVAKQLPAARLNEYLQRLRVNIVT